MNELGITTAPLPAPRVGLSFRTATTDDLPFIDDLQKKNSKGLGYFPTAQLTGYVTGGYVLVAEDDTGTSILDTGGETPGAPSIKHPVSSVRPLGYCISKDRYLKRDELGVIYQLCVVPGHQRKLVGAALVQEVFKRSAYGCRLYCLWCAQDLPANHFWESLGFVPIAFRAGSDKKKRVHIFWQRRIVESDASMPYWYPSSTNGGSIRADRLVFPIPPGTHWTEVQAVAVPVVENAEAKRLSDDSNSGARSGGAHKPRMAKRSPLLSPLPRLRTPGGIRFAPAVSAEPVEKGAAPKRKKKPTKIDPKFLAANRELRDRYLEQLNTRDVVGCGKYDVSRALPSKAPVPLLNAA